MITHKLALEFMKERLREYRCPKHMDPIPEVYRKKNYTVKELVVLCMKLEFMSCDIGLFVNTLTAILDDHYHHLVKTPRGDIWEIERSPYVSIKVQLSRFHHFLDEAEALEDRSKDS